jgi:spoIIIJ-associated protein
MTGATIEEAIQAGLDELEVSRESVIVEILEEPSRGILGLGAKPARVRLTTAARPRAKEEERPLFSSAAPARERDEPAERRERPERRERYNRYERQERYDRRPLPDDRDADDEDEDEGLVFVAPGTKVIPEEELTPEAKVGRETIQKLLGMLDIPSQVVVESSGEGEDQIIILQITGDDLGTLIGRKGETLIALQYVARLMVSHSLHQRVNFMVDAGGYKAKRTEMLRRLAERMADQAVERHRTVKLEPMPPHERRIIHMTLRKRGDVTTKSVGEGAARKVTIIPQV